MKKLKDFWKSLDGYTVVRKRGLLLFCLNLFLLGMNIGVMLSPRKTVTIGCNNTSAKAAEEAKEEK